MREFPNRAREGPLLRQEQNSGVLLGRSPGIGPSSPGTVQQLEILAVVGHEYPPVLGGMQQNELVGCTRIKPVADRDRSVSGVPKGVQQTG